MLAKLASVSLSPRKAVMHSFQASYKRFSILVAASILVGINIRIHNFFVAIPAGNLVGIDIGIDHCFISIAARSLLGVQDSMIKSTIAVATTI